MQQRTKAFNERKGELTGYDCPVCKNKGMIIHIDDRGMEFHEICKCMEIRNSMDRINRSGLKSLMHSCTFETYQTNTLWQKNALQEAKNFLQDHIQKAPDEKERLKAAELLGKRYGLFTDKVRVDVPLPIVITGEDKLAD